MMQRVETSKSQTVQKENVDVKKKKQLKFNVYMIKQSVLFFLFKTDANYAMIY